MQRDAPHSLLGCDVRGSFLLVTGSRGVESCDSLAEVKRVLCLLALLLWSCVSPARRAVAPVRLVADKPAGDADHLVVFLRGRSNRPEEFRIWGMFAQARRRWPRARLVAPDLHPGYYYTRTATRRLHEDVVAPARAGGATKITLVGISLGGLGALLYELEHPGMVDEIILLSPYLGEDQVWREIAVAGGIAGWQPGLIATDDYSRQLWQGLRQRWPQGAGAGRVRIACGEGDRFLPANRLFAESFLASGDFVWLPGGHNWPTWLKAFTALEAS
jgi:pimeloyl-ACP methyl ester carboxylesterase